MISCQRFKIGCLATLGILALLLIGCGGEDEEFQSVLKAVNASPTAAPGLTDLDSNEESDRPEVDVNFRGNNGTLVNGPVWVDGKFGKALQFDGVDDYVDLGVSPTLNLSHAFTIAAWVNYPTAANNMTIYGSENLDLGINRRISLRSNAFTLDCGEAGYTEIAVEGPIPPGQWVHYVGTWDGQTMRVYWDALEKGSAEQSCTLPEATGSYLGRQGHNAWHLKGAIDDVRLFHWALSGQEVLNLFKGEAALWALDEGVDAIAYDTSGNANSGALTNSPAWVEGYLRTALNFDGVDDYVDLGADSNLELSRALSIAAWVNYPTAGNDMTIYGSENVGLELTRRVSLRSNAFTLDCGGSGYVEVAIQGTIPAGQWVHYVATWDGRTMKVYWDGQEKGSALATCPLPPATGNYIGRQGAIGWYFHGAIDQVHVYNRALSQAEVTELYLGLVGHWDLNEGAGLIAADAWSSK